MQVSHTNDHVTHAIIGGGETIDFGISSSAEFFNILSSTLYKDQILAVVREVLCNAWDAHIEAGCTDKPIVVELVDNKLIVRDSGKGIHHEDIGLIYGTYGNSTKKNDGKQTGGFGLGCKAPFAYTEHFEVTSSNDGVRTIYAMSKSSAQVGGKPGITTIAQFPTTETGLSVSINVKPTDVKNFENLIKRIAYNGDMNVMLNGTQLDTIEFDVTSNNWMVKGGTSDPMLDSVNVFLVRYGNVVYPIDITHPELVNKANRINGLLYQMRGDYNSHYWVINILFQAPSHSIAVTPSRESLSMQEHTIKTIDKLFSDFLAQVDAHYEADRLKNIATVITTSVAEKKVNALLNVDHTFPGAVQLQRIQSLKATTIDALAKRNIAVRYPQCEKFRTADVTLRVKELSKAGLIPRGLATTYLEAVKARPTGKGFGIGVRSHDGTTWLKKKVIGRLVTKLLAAGLETGNLRVWDANMETTRSDGQANMYRAKPRNIFNCLPYLRNIIVLTGSTYDINNRVANLPDSPTTKGLSSFLFYVLGRKKEEREAAQAFFAKSGMTVVDMTILEVTDKKPVVAVAKPRLKGLPSLGEAVIPNSRTFSMERVFREGAKRVEDPKIIFMHLKSRPNYLLDGFSSEASTALSKIFGDVAGICNTNTQFNSWQKKVLNSTEYLHTNVLDFVKGSAAIQESLSTGGDAIDTYIGTFRSPYVLMDMERYKMFTTLLNLKSTPLTEIERNYRILFLNLLNNNTAFSTAAKASIDITLNKDCKALVDKASKSTLLKLINLNETHMMLKDANQKQKALNLLKHALNN